MLCIAIFAWSHILCPNPFQHRNATHQRCRWFRERGGPRAGQPEPVKSTGRLDLQAKGRFGATRADDLRSARCKDSFLCSVACACLKSRWTSVLCKTCRHPFLKSSQVCPCLPFNNAQAKFNQLKVVRLCAQDEYIVIGCDGIWERKQNAEMVG